MTFVKIPFWRWPLLFWLIGCLAATGTAEAALGEQTGRRVALVVGNTDYRSVPRLKNAARDAEGIARTLTSLGFEVIDRTDVTRAEFKSALEEFYAATADAEAAVIFYSGHGFQMNGVNYLVPVDATLRDRGKIDEETIRLDEIARHAESANRQTLIFLDACRNNPLPEDLRARSAGEGLAQLETGSGTFIAFATQPGNITRDGAGDHSPFTSALLEHMPTPGISISDMMIRVRNSVEVATLHTQTPWDQSSLRSQFYFNPEAEPEAEGELTDEDREMLLALDPAMRQKFEAKFGIRIDDADLPEEEPSTEMAAIQPMVRIEAAEDDAGLREPQGASEGGGPSSQGPQDEIVPTTLRIMPGVPFEDPGMGVSLGPVTSGGVVAQTGRVSPLPVPRYDPATKATVADTSIVPRNVGRGGAAPRSLPSTRLASVSSPNLVTASIELTPEGRQVDVGLPVKGQRVGGNAAGVAARADTGPSLLSPPSYEVAALASAERSVTLGVLPTASLAPAAPEWRRIVGQEVVGQDVAGSSVSMSPEHGVPARPSAPDVEVAALDPAALDPLGGSPPDRPDEPTAPETPQAVAPADLPSAVQKELARLGCYRSSIDGDWGSGSARALLRYYATKKTDPDLLDPSPELFARLSGEDQVVCTRTETKPQPVRPAIAARPQRQAPQQASRPTRAAPQQAARPPKQQPARQRVARPQAPQAPARTVATRPAPPLAPAKREAATAAPKKSLKKGLTLGAFR